MVYQKREGYMQHRGNDNSRCTNDQRKCVRMAKKGLAFFMAG
jgi:hypothetical protein